MTYRRHILTNIDTEAMRAVCSTCGETRLRWNQNRLRCNKRKEGRPSSEWHRLSNVNIDNMTATCAICGTTDIKLQEGKTRCVTGVKEAGRRTKLKQRYGITEPMGRPDGRCEICKTRSGIHVDHDHTTGVVRGMLCSQCNTALGMVYESTNILHNMIRYLGKHKAK